MRSIDLFCMRMFGLEYSSWYEHMNGQINNHAAQDPTPHHTIWIDCTTYPCLLSYLPACSLRVVMEYIAHR